MSRFHPYQNLPDRSFWRRSVAQPPAEAVDPVGEFTMRIGPETKVATAGSCFAQHIARHLARSGFSFLVSEPGHPMISEEQRRQEGYGLFSARYGNIYTARQLRQLFERAFGTFVPREGHWLDQRGLVLDPFRPTAQPGGYASVSEMLADRRQHLAAVRRMFESLDVFVFTLGLTEGWISSEDGAAFPLCPGVEGGTFDPSRHVFHNQSVIEVVEDLSLFRQALKAINARASIMLTVSPVPLAATAVPGQHVLCATTYSKSVLRVAAETVSRAHDDVHYFPSFEIVTGAHARGRYFAPDLRNVTEEGVEHVMRVFLDHAAGLVASRPSHVTQPATVAAVASSHEVAQAWVDARCEELALDPDSSD